jgi:hypothetical protein
MAKIENGIQIKNPCSNVVEIAIVKILLLLLNHSHDFYLGYVGSTDYL